MSIKKWYDDRQMFGFLIRRGFSVKKRPIKMRFNAGHNDTMTEEREVWTVTRNGEDVQAPWY